MHRTERTTIAAMTVLSSLAFYWYARYQKQDTGPFVMIGGFIGTLIGEAMAQNIKTLKPLDSY